MNFSQKYKIIKNIRNAGAAPEISHETTGETYQLEAQPYQIKANIQLPQYDGEQTTYTIMLANTKNNEIVHTERDTFFAKLVTKIIERKYYRAGRIK